jgi:hypothetical protein
VIDPSPLGPALPPLTTIWPVNGALKVPVMTPSSPSFRAMVTPPTVVVVL